MEKMEFMFFNDLIILNYEKKSLDAHSCKANDFSISLMLMNKYRQVSVLINLFQSPLCQNSLMEQLACLQGSFNVLKLFLGSERV